MSDICEALHGFVWRLPEVRWPFMLDQLPRNGIYFFFEAGELAGHGSDRPRIVRVGTHREGNFRSRMADHYIVNERKMNFTREQGAPKDRSIFRKNIGRAILNRDHNPYLATWEIDFTTRSARESRGAQRDLEKERAIEATVTQQLRERFSFRWIAVEGQERRMGTGGLESALIGTVSGCKCCRPSKEWLGRFSPKSKIAESGMWLEQHLYDPGFSLEAFAQFAREFAPKA